MTLSRWTPDADLEVFLHREVQAALQQIFRLWSSGHSCSKTDKCRQAEGSNWSQRIRTMAVRPRAELAQVNSL